jgi:predicted DNA-binding transcriptional regulator YafY
MRASRLVQLLLLLQARGRLTAGTLAVELEVSERTIHRDVEALSAAGVPIYAERGPHGGIQLVDGYRTRLTGLTGDEAEALFLSGLPGPAAELGLGTVVAAARLKVLAALPTELRARASRLVERFHLDVAGWFHTTDPVPHLGVLADAVWESRRVTVGYRRAGGEVNRILEPLGLVLKAGVWYIVAAADGQVRTYRVSRFSRATPGEATFQRPADFDLASYWRESIAEYERSAPSVEVIVRVDPTAIGILADAVGERAVRAAERIGPVDADGWQRLRLTVDWPEEVPGRLVAMGDRLEIVEPAEIRDAVVAIAERVIDRYRPLSSAHR